MGFFDKMFGSGAAAAALAPTGEHRFNELKGKYSSVLTAIEQRDVQLVNLHVQDNKLFIRGTAPNEAAANGIWDQIKVVDQNWANDLTAEISVNPKPVAQTEAYTVVAGDSLWKIAKNKLGDGNEYMKIFYANRDKMKAPTSVIHPGDVLNIPKA
jgi:nucleoid-associated protein YgaU